ncbi:MAG: non-canonical purine NTP pyrophosphatase, partial [Flavobacteriales bacterium]
MKITFATNNPHKLNEVKNAVGEDIEILSIRDIGCYEELPETSPGIEGNAQQKAKYVHDHYHVNCFADDNGLEVEALNGEPGVYSARYAGENCSFDDNMDKLLRNMKGIEDRRAKFRTVIAFIFNGEVHYFEGAIDGHILKEKSGEQGFGY